MEKPILVENCVAAVFSMPSVLSTLNAWAAWSTLMRRKIQRSRCKTPQIPVDKANMPKQIGKPPQVVFPESERRQLAERPLDPAIRKAIVEDNNVQQRAALGQAYAARRGMLEKWQTDLRKGVPTRAS